VFGRREKRRERQTPYRPTKIYPLKGGEGGWERLMYHPLGFDWNIQFV
jgi:hypothetical protein